MLLQKTSWRIKQFISHRKNDSEESIGDGPGDGCLTDAKLSTSTPPKRLSWLSQAPSSEATTPLRRASSNATSRSLHLIIPTNTTAHSSASSLCSCDCAPELSLNGDSLSKPCTARSQLEILYLPSSTPPNVSGNVKRCKLVFSEPFANSPASDESDPDLNTSPGSTIAAESTFDLMEALGEIDPEIELMDNDKTPTQSIRIRDEPGIEPASDNVEQLIRETDEAFEAVDSALAEARAISHEWYDDEDAPIVRNFAVSRSAARKPPRPPASPLKPQIGRNISVTKTTAKKTRFIKRKTNLFGRKLRNVPPPPANTPSRWTLTDMTTNMADVFSGKIFRTEVDEMLTPGRIQKLKDEKLEAQRPSSQDSTQSGETDSSTPTNPFHLESLSRRISAAQGKDLAAPALDGEIPPKKILDGSSSKQRKVKFADLSLNSQSTDPGMTIADLTFPSPPRTPKRPSASPSAPNSRSGSTPLLPTIPEVSPLSFPLLRSPSKSQELHSKAASPSPVSYILLPSTPFTAVSPQFRHGSIRVERILRSRKGSSPEEEALDWTAFQMAISGTMGCDPEVTPLSLSDDTSEAELDALMSWFSSFSFPGYGMLVDGQLEAETSSHNPDLIPPLEIATAKLRIATVSSNARRVSEDSLPPSPMLDLSMLVQGEDVIPMGFNLGHDLGDFLRWEAEQVQSLIVND